VSTAGASAPRDVAIVGAGWAGLAAAVRAVQAGHRVTLMDTAAQPGGRARSVRRHGQVQDNGQHILIGAYVRTLDLMATVGAAENALLLRRPLALLDGAGQGLTLPGGPALVSFARGVLAHRHWPLRDRIALLLAAGRWLAAGFRCEPDRPVADWAAGLPATVRDELLEPLCVAALNTPARQASAAVLLRVLRDALFAAPGSADLLLPRAPLGQLLPEPAAAWLERHGATLRWGQRAVSLEADGTGWRLDGQRHDAVVLACPALEAARLAAPHAPDWSTRAAGFGYEPIITAWVEAPAVRFPYPMLALRGEPAQFAFDLGALHGGGPGPVTLVCSGAAAWVDAGTAAFEAALTHQINSQLAAVLPQGWTLRDTLTEKRATFRCTPGLQRPGQQLAPGLLAAGDYVEGPYPATLEGAVRSGESAVRALGHAAAV
jgi:squalene-associated FAD-dependent desaturase